MLLLEGLATSEARNFAALIPTEGLFGCLHVHVRGGTSTYKIPVAVDVVDAVHRGPVLVDPESAGRETRSFARIWPVPFGDQVLDGMRRVLERIILSVHAAFFDRPCLFADGQHRIAK